MVASQIIKVGEFNPMFILPGISGPASFTGEIIPKEDNALEAGDSDPIMKEGIITVITPNPVNMLLPVVIGGSIFSQYDARTKALILPGDGLPAPITEATMNDN